MHDNMRKAAPWALPVALTAVSLAWSVYAIGDLLSAQANPWFAYSTAALYDAVWLYALTQERAHRRQGSDAKLPRTLGWIFLPVTVAVLALHGWTAAEDGLLAAVGAVIPILAKMTLVMAIDRDETRISEKAQKAIDKARATTRDRIAITRALRVTAAEEITAAAELEELTSEADAKALEIVHGARETYAEAAEEYPLPEEAGTLPELISDADLAALLRGAEPSDVSAGGMGGFDTSGMGPGMGSGRPPAEGSAEAAKEANDKAVALLAAELYATDPPPSLTQFRKTMRAAMTGRGLAGSWATIDELYRREKNLRGADAEDGAEADA